LLNPSLSLSLFTSLSSASSSSTTPSSSLSSLADSTTSLLPSLSLSLPSSILSIFPSLSLTFSIFELGSNGFVFGFFCSILLTPSLSLSLLGLLSWESSSSTTPS
jgi:hypothetical protein